MSKTPRTDAQPIMAGNKWAGVPLEFARTLEAELHHYQGLAEWAETLLCNALPQPHCSQAEWDSIVTRWRDALHGLSTPALNMERSYEEDLAKYAESVAHLCRCARDRPCDGVLAGGLCDNIQEEDRDLEPEDENDESDFT